MTPTVAFVTFEKIMFKEWAREILLKDPFKLFDLSEAEVEMKQGPQNIKWENKLRYRRHFSLRSAFVVIMSFSLYYVLFAHIYLLKNKI